MQQMAAKQSTYGRAQLRRWLFTDAADMMKMGQFLRATGHQQRGSMLREGTLHIVCLNHGRPGNPKFHVGFSDYASRKVATIHREIVTEDALRKFLTDQVKIHPDAVALATERLKVQGNAAIFHTPLTDEQLSALGLK